VPTITLPDDEFTAVTAAIRRAIEDDRYPHAPRLDPLRAALARFEAATGARSDQLREDVLPKLVPSKAPLAKADKRTRR
jgi:hypothetical protein